MMSMIPLLLVSAVSVLAANNAKVDELAMAQAEAKAYRAAWLELKSRDELLGVAALSPEARDSHDKVARLAGELIRSEKARQTVFEKAKAAEKRFLAGEKAKAGIRVLKNGVLVQELRAGSGRKPGPKDRIQVRYIGYLADGSQFDESQAAQWFRLDSVIAGWRSAVQEMPVGAQWRLVIPSAQAYGEEGAGDLIPPYSPLVFELELLDTKE